MSTIIILLLCFLVLVLFSRTSALAKRLSRLEKHLIQSNDNPQKHTFSQTNDIDITEKESEPTPSHGWTENEIDSTNKQPTNHLNILFSKIIHYFSTGNTLAKVGVLVLLFGIVFLLKYASDHSLLPLNIRLISAAVFAVVLLAIGWKVQPKKQEYGLVLQGGGIGILYATTFISYRLYQLLSPEVCFALLIAISLLAIVLALLRDSKTLIFLAQLGGFLTPILASGHQGSEIALFSHYALLSIMITIIAWFKAWRALNLTGFVFTFMIASAWGYWQYQASFYLVSQLFLVLFILLYSAIIVLFTRNLQRLNNNYLDSSLIFGVPFVGFAIQAALTYHFANGHSISAAAFALYYAVFAYGLYRFRGPSFKAIYQAYAYIASAFVFLTLVFALSPAWAGLACALAALLKLCFGLKHDKLTARVIALAVLCLAVLSGTETLLQLVFNQLTLLHFIDSILTDIFAIIAATLLALHNNSRHIEKQTVAPVLFILASLFWFTISLLFFTQYYPALYSLVYFALCCMACAFFAIKHPWKYLKILALGLTPLLYIYMLNFETTNTSLTTIDYACWPLALVFQYGILYALQRGTSEQTRYLPLHAATYWLATWCATSLVFHSTYYNLHLTNAWSTSASILTLLLSLGIIQVISKKLPASIANYYQQLISLPIVLVIFLWSLFANLLLLPIVQHFIYIPVLNPFDLSMALSLTVISIWSYQQRHWLSASSSYLVTSLSAWSFIWVSAMILRTVHYWCHVPYAFNAMLNSGIAQTSLSLFWAIFGFAIIWISSRRNNKKIWYIGVSVLLIVILKLFFIDLANSQTIARIISFIGVGLTLVLVGYFSPVRRIEK